MPSGIQEAMYQHWDLLLQCVVGATNKGIDDLMGMDDDFDFTVVLHMLAMQKRQSTSQEALLPAYLDSITTFATDQGCKCQSPFLGATTSLYSSGRCYR